MSVHCMCAWRPQKSQKGIKTTVTGVVDSCKLPCAYWEPNPHHLQKQQVLLNHWAISIPPTLANKDVYRILHFHMDFTAKALVTKQQTARSFPQFLERTVSSLLPSVTRSTKSELP